MSIKMIFASAAALAMVAGTPAFAAKSQGERQHAVASESGGGEKARKICRRFKNTVSRMKAEKVCLTRAEWKKVDAEQM